MRLYFKGDMAQGVTLVDFDATRCGEDDFRSAATPVGWPDGQPAKRNTGLQRETELASANVQA